CKRSDPAAPPTRPTLGPRVSRMTDKPLTDIAFSSFDLHPDLLSGLEGAGFARCTPLQALTLPITTAGRDVAGQARTGTGKALAYLLSVVHRLRTLAQPAERHATDTQDLTQS